MLLGLIGVIAFGTLGTISTHASNWHDIPYNLRYSGDGGDVDTGYGYKTDDSSVYIKNNGDCRVYVSIRTHNSSNNYVWGGGYVLAPLGQGFKIDNNVWETFHNPINIYLGLTPEWESPCNIYGVWSPDSI